MANIPLTKKKQSGLMSWVNKAIFYVDCDYAKICLKRHYVFLSLLAMGYTEVAV